MSCYTTLDDLKALLGLTSTTDDSLLLDMIRSASRDIDGPYGANREFFVRENETRYFEATSGIEIMTGDLLAVTALASDDDFDAVYETTWASADYTLEPTNRYPKQRIVLPIGYSEPFGRGRNRYAVTGSWGYGDGESASPWLTTAITVTASTAGATSATASAAGTIKAGHTILVESEQMFVSAVSGTTLTVDRGVNGTTAAAHTAKAASIAKYPHDVVSACRWLAAESWNGQAAAGISNEGTMFYRASFAAISQEQRRRMLGRVYMP